VTVRARVVGKIVLSHMRMPASEIYFADAACGLVRNIDIDG